MTYRDVPTVKIGNGAKPAKGKRPDGVIWLKPSELSIDTRYQRELGPLGVARVRQIAAAFDWRKFTPVIVAKRESGGGWAVIDGQHRAAAVLARGDIPAIPCWPIDGDVGAQARTFLSINAESARVPNGATWYARAAAGDQKAIALFDVLRTAEVHLMRYGRQARERRPDETMAAAEIANLIASHSPDLVSRALVILRKAGGLAGRSLLMRSLIRSVVLLCKHDALWKREPNIHIAVAELDLEEIEARAAIKSREDGGSRVAHMLAIVRDRVQASVAP